MSESGLTPVERARRTHSFAMRCGYGCIRSLEMARGAYRSAGGKMDVGLDGRGNLVEQPPERQRIYRFSRKAH